MEVTTACVTDTLAVKILVIAVGTPASAMPRPLVLLRGPVGNGQTELTFLSVGTVGGRRLKAFLDTLLEKRVHRAVGSGGCSGPLASWAVRGDGRLAIVGLARQTAIAVFAFRPANAHY